MNNIGPTTAGKKWPDSALRQRREDTALATSECRYRRLFEAAKDGILILDAESGRVVDANPFLIGLLGYSHEEFVGKALWELGFFHDANANRENFLELQEKGYIRYENLPLETADGRHVNVEFVSNVYPEGDKNVIQCNIRDITTRKQVESFHETGREILQILNAPDDMHEIIMRVLDLLKTRTGFDAVGMRLQDGEDYPYYGQQGFPEEFLRTQNTRVERGGDDGMCRDKSEGNLYLECMCGLVVSGKTDPSIPHFTPGGSFWTNDVGLLLELPDERNPRIHPRNKCIYQGHASVALVPIRNKNRIVGLFHFSDRSKDFCSIEMVELLEEMATHFGEALARKQTDVQLERISRLPSEDPNPVLRVSVEGILEYANAAADLLVQAMGTQLGGAVNAEWQAHIDTAVAATGPIHIECQVADRTFAITFATIADCDYVNLYALDITEQKKAEEEHGKMQLQLTQAQKMEAVGQLAGGVAHDFNNMLSVILGQIGLALERISPSDPLFESLQEIKGAAKRSADLTRQLLAFARRQEIAPKILNINNHTSAMIPMLRRLSGENINLVWRPGAGLRMVKIDPSQVDQIFINLCINARAAIDSTGTISLETGNIEIDAEYCATHVDATPGAYVFLSVSDDGVGMDPATLEHIFEPFFTTKEIGQGTGLGLATVYGIVKQNNGFVYAYSEPGLGSTFKIYLPQAKEQAASRTTPAPASAPKGQGETILMVEDNQALQKVYKQFLAGLGYALLSAETPEEALRLSTLHPEIHLLLTDVVMPGMNGRQLAEKIRAANPGILVLFMSGYTADIVAMHGVLEPHMDFIGKPFTRDELGEKLRELLKPVA